MDKKNLAIALFAVCLLCFITGLFTPTQKAKIPQNINIDTSIIENSGNKIALLNIDGAISADNQNSAWTNEFNSQNFLDSLYKAQNDKKVKAIIIRINSPGGTVAASQDIYDAVMRTRLVKPVVVSMADVCASGGYYIASAADRIVAQKGTMTGSIGVIFNFVDVAKLADKWGVHSNVIKSGKYKDAGNMYRNMSNDERAIFQASVNTAYGQFVEAINNGRIKRNDTYDVPRKTLSYETLKQYADGRVFLGDEAYKLGFVDYLGSMFEATSIAANLAGYDTLPVVPYNKFSGIKGFLMGMDSKIFEPIKEYLPFSYSHSSQPLLIME